MKVNWANLRVFFKELQFKDVMNSWKVKELVFLLLVLWLALMFPRVIPPRSTNNRGLPLQSSCPAYVNILFWSRTKYWKLESFFPLEPKLQVWEITVLSLLSEVSQMLNWDYIKCKFYFFLVRQHIHVSASAQKYTVDTLTVIDCLVDSYLCFKRNSADNHAAPGFFPNSTNITILETQ